MISSRGLKQRIPFFFGVLAILGLTVSSGGFLEAQAQSKKDAKPAAATKDATDGAKDGAKDAESGDAKDAKDTKDAKDSKKEAVKKEVKFVPNFPPVKDKMVSTQGQVQVSKINELIKEKWAANHINPSPRCSDYEFIRRASLDLIGRIATEKEIAAYRGQPEDTRRSWLIEKLLASPEFGENFANIWTVMMLTRTGSLKDYQEMMREWLTERFNSDLGPDKKMADWSSIVFDILAATGKDNDNAAVNYIAHHIGEEIKSDESKKGRASEADLHQNGRWDMIPVTSRTTRLFLGLRTQCVQCHDHPFNGDWLQSHFWGINAFFRQTDVSQRPSMMMAKKKKGQEIKTVHVEVHDNDSYNEKGIVSYENRRGLLFYTGMQFLDGKRVKTIPTGSSRRQELAKLITKSPYFAKEYVNRTWAHFLGKSFTRDAADDFGEHNPVTNPELLDYLSEEFSQKYSHSPKDLMRWICNSQAYGLSSKTNVTNDGVAREGDDRTGSELFFPRVVSKVMSPEQLFDSLMTATAGRVMSQRMSGEIKTPKEKTSKDKKGAPDAKTADKKVPEAMMGMEAKEEYRKNREKWLDSLVLNFGNDEGDEATFSGTVVQALMLINGKDINDAIMDQQSGTVAAITIGEKKGLSITKAQVDTLYLAALNRPCSTEEFQKINNPQIYRYFDPRAKGGSVGSAHGNLAYYQDIFWALLNSSEFILNH